MLKPVKVVEPRVQVVGDEEQNHIVLFGGSRVTEQVVVADSAQIAPANPVNALFTINPPSTMTIVDRNVRVRAYLEVTTDQPHQLGSHDALRAFPLNSIIDVTAVQINGENISENSGEKYHALNTYGMDNEARGKVVSTSPSYPDQFQEYSDAISLYGSAKNALSNYGESSTECGGRGGFPVQVVSPTVFRVVVTESLAVAPFLNGNHTDEEGMVNVNQMNINLRFTSNLSRVFSHSSLGNAITTVTCKFYSAPEVLVRFITPSPVAKIPEVQHLPYYSDQDYVKNIGTIAPMSGTVVYSDSIKLGQIPESVYIFARHSRATADFKKCDSFLAITNVSILFNNESGLLANATEQDLYEIASSNGCQLSYPGFHTYRGGVLRLRFGKDIGLPDYLAPGCQTQATIQIKVTFENRGSQDFNADFYTVYRNIGTFSVFENGARASVGNLTPDLVRMAVSAPELTWDHYKAISGGSFWSKLKSIGKKVAHAVAKVAPVAQKVASVVAPEFAPAIGTVGRLAGMVGSGAPVGGRLAGGRVRRRMR